MATAIPILSENTVTRIRGARAVSSARDAYIAAVISSSQTDIDIPSPSELAAEGAEWDAVFSAKVPALSAAVEALKIRVAAGEATPLDLRDL